MFDRTQVFPALASVLWIVGGSLSVSCSSRPGAVTDPIQEPAAAAGGSGTTMAAPSAPRSSQQAGATAPKSSTVAAAAGQPAAAGGAQSIPATTGGVPAQPPVAGNMSTETGASGAPMVRDCTPVAWDNPGKVGTVTLAEIPADAGKNKQPFEQTEGMEEFNYEWKEFLFTGTSPAYTTRLFVKKPKDPAKFSGTVFVEWYNVSGGIDFAVLWANSREYFMREGHVFIGVSAQSGGAGALKSMVDADRYAKINHPGDNYANAIYSQAGVAVRTQTEALLGPCMPVHALISVGQSQSGVRLADYLNNAQPKDKVYDAHMIHSGQEPASNNPAVPTFVIFTMSEGNGRLMDGPNLVEWMVAGATHNDARVTNRGMALGKVIGVAGVKCANPLNEFPSYRAYSAALDWLERWVREGTKPPAGMPFKMTGNQIAQDMHKNALGGVRIADIEVPIATHGFDNGPADPSDLVGLLACGLGGEEIPFTPAELMQLYPTHDDYVSKYTAAADKAVAAGYLLQADRDDGIKQAQAAAIPK